MKNHDDDECDVSRYDMIGFDMDHTLVRYHLSELYDLMHNALCDYLVNSCQYPESALMQRKRDHSFAIKGMIFDVEKGNFIVINEHGHVISYRHGTNPMTESKEQIFNAYPHGEQWPHIHDVSSFNHDNTKYVNFLSAFGLPAVFVMALLVDWIDDQYNENLQRVTEYKRAVECIFGGFSYHYNPESFVLDQGHFFPNLKRNPKLYLKKVSDDVLRLIARWRSIGKKVFLLTNSREDFTQMVCEYALGENWKSLFDFIVCHAQKPSFFRSQDAFRVLSEQPLMLSGGSNHALIQLLDIHPRPGQVLYFGDDIQGDVFAPTVLTANSWNCISVLEELERPYNLEHLAFIKHYFNEDPEKCSLLFRMIQKHALYCISSVEEYARAYVNGDT